MTQYKLKKEVRKFFAPEWSTRVGTLDYWNSQNVGLPILDKAWPVAVEYGHKNDNGGSDLSTYDSHTQEYSMFFTLKVFGVNKADLQPVELIDELQDSIYDFLERKELL